MSYLRINSFVCLSNENSAGWLKFSDPHSQDSEAEAELPQV